MFYLHLAYMENGLGKTQNAYMPYCVEVVNSIESKAVLILDNDKCTICRLTCSVILTRS